MEQPLASHATNQGWGFDNSYTCLPESFYIKQNPIPVRAPNLVIFNHALAESLGLDSNALSKTDSAMIFAGNLLPTNAEPIAQAYAGHQFGHFTMLGDGRAILLGEQITPTGQRFDIQLKGSGQTPFSRGGDGRAALGPMLREYIISEAMHALGIPTTRSLAVVTTGEPVYRDTVLTGAILTRVAASHIRVGTFQYAAARGNIDELRALADYTINRHYPEIAKADNPYLGLLQAVMKNQAALVAKWQCVGFIHGVMNTDNMTLSGETIDYGPCAFMGTYDPATVFSSIDRHGRYAYQNQPVIAQWNLARLAETLLSLLDSNEDIALKLAETAISSFPALFESAWLKGMRAKLGLFNEEDQDTILIQTLLTWMHANQQDFTNTFRLLSSPTPQNTPIWKITGFQDWYTQWQSRLSRQPESFDEARQLMNKHNPSVIPRNHQVEKALKAATEQSDLTVLHKLLSVLSTPYADLKPEDTDYTLLPEPGSPAYKTFCGT